MTGPAASLELTVNAVDAEAVAAFWQRALGYRMLYRRPPYLVLGPGPGLDPGPRVLVQQVPEHAGPGTRVHLDLRVPDPQAEVDRLIGLGAVLVRVVDERTLGGSRWWVLTDPEGTEFCVCPSR